MSDDFISWLTKKKNCFVSFFIEKNSLFFSQFDSDDLVYQYHKYIDDDDYHHHYDGNNYLRNCHAHKINQVLHSFTHLLYWYVIYPQYTHPEFLLFFSHSNFSCCCYCCCYIILVFHIPSTRCIATFIYFSGVYVRDWWTSTSPHTHPPLPPSTSSSSWLPTLIIHNDIKWTNQTFFFSSFFLNGFSHNDNQPEKNWMINCIFTILRIFNTVTP